MNLHIADKISGLKGPVRCLVDSLTGSAITKLTGHTSEQFSREQRNRKYNVLGSQPNFVFDVS